MKSGQKGFTLIELIVVITILAILAAFSIPLVTDWLDNAQYREASQEVIQALRLGQSGSVTKNREYRVEFDLANDDTYSFRVLEGDRASNSTNFNTVVMTWLDTGIPTAVVLRGVNPANGNCTVTADTIYEFYPNGTSDQIGGICVLDRDGLIRSGVLIRSTATARVTVEKWDWTNPAWP